MTLDKLTRFANIAQRWRKTPGAHNLVADYHLRQALTEFWCERSHEIDRSVGTAFADDRSNAFAHWCHLTLGYMPGITGTGSAILFERPEHSAIFHLRWHCVSE